MSELAEAKEQHIHDVVVVGLGVAGLTAAQSLSRTRKGLDVLGLEASHRVGGRVWGYRGAGLIHGDHSPIKTLAVANGLSLTKVSDDHGILAGRPDIRDVIASFPEALPGESAAIWATRAGYTNTNLPDLLAYLDHDDEPLSRTSAEFLQSWILRSLDEYNGELYNDNDYIINEGFDAIIPILAHGVRHKRWARVNLIDTTQDIAEIHYRHHGSPRQALARVVICAVPNEILKRGGIEFNPDLPPRKLQAIQALGCVSVAKQIAEFERPVFNDEHNYALTIPGLQSELWGSGNFVFGWSAGRNARAVQSMTESAVLQEFMIALRTKVRGPLPELKDFWIVDWTGNRFAGGAYSYVPPGAPEGVHEIAAESVGNLLFTGEATHWDPATVNAAHLAGLRVADEARLLLG